MALTKRHDDRHQWRTDAFSKPPEARPIRHRLTWWPLFGVARRLTERRRSYPAPVAPKSLGRLFRRSLFVYPIDVGNSNALNVEVAALRTPQYNVTASAIFFTDAPRHADLLLVLGRPTVKTSIPLEETVRQLPSPFGIIQICEPFPPAERFVEAELPNLIAKIEGTPSAEEILGLLRAAAERRGPASHAGSAGAK